MPQEPKDSPEKGGVSRRNIFGAASLATAGIAATSLWTRQASAADEEKKGEKPKIEPIENFKYDLEKQTHWVGPGGSAKEATVDEFPVSQSLAGVSMRLDPGAIRELHWHALAAEWAYVLEGRVRTTVVMPNGQTEVDDFEVGDTWYGPYGSGALAVRHVPAGVEVRAVGASVAAFARAEASAFSSRSVPQMSNPRRRR